MNHDEALQMMATERYLLGELTAEDREHFEEHFFACVDCAADVRAASEFITHSKVVLSTPPASERASVPVSARARPRFRLWPALAWATLSALLAVVLYQNTVEYPRAKHELAALRSPEILSSATLVNSRSAGLPQIRVGRGEPFLVLVDIPDNGGSSSYVAELYGPAQELEWSRPISSEAAKDTVKIRVPGVEKAGDYALVLRAKNPDGSTGPETRRYGFQVVQK